MFWSIVGFIAVALSLGGNVGVVQRKRWGMGVWNIANVLWIGYYIHHQQWPPLLLFTAYLGLSIWGYIRWKEPESSGPGVSAR